MVSTAVIDDFLAQEHLAFVGVSHEPKAFKGAGPSSVSEEAVALCRDHGIEVVDGACPMMFMPDASWLHRVHRWGRHATGHLTD